MTETTASVHWEGQGKKGLGSISTETGAMKDYPYGFASRFEDDQRGTNPEEILGAAHAACFTMAFSFACDKAGFATAEVDTAASVRLSKQGEAFVIDRIALTLQAVVPGIDDPVFQEIETFDKLFAVAPHTPILTLSELDDSTLATEAVQRGSQGYLTKGGYGSELVPQSLRNTIQRKAVEGALFVEKARAEITLNSISEAVIGTDLAGNVDYLNRSAEAMTGWSRAEAHGLPISEVMRIISGTTREPEENPVVHVLRHNKSTGLTAWTILIRRDGREATIADSVAPIHDWNGLISGAVMVFHDTTAAQETALRMTHLAQHDFLTDLPNRLSRTAQQTGFRDQE